MAIRKLRMGKEGKAKSMRKKKHRRALNVWAPNIWPHEDSNEHTPCDFCGLKNSSVNSVQKDDCISWQKCDTWCHEFCVGTADRRQFVCRKFLWFCFLNLNEHNSHTAEWNSPTICDIYTALFEMIVGWWSDATRLATSFSRCNSMWFLSMGLRQGPGLCSSSSRKYAGTKGTNQNRHWNHHRW